MCSSSSSVRVTLKYAVFPVVDVVIIHLRCCSGLVSNSVGGCATLQLVSNFTDFLPLTANGLTSIGFPTIFPLAFRFLPETSLSHCEDLRNPALAFNVIITALLFLVLRPKPIVLYWCLVCIGYWHVTLFSQPRASPPPIDQAFESFLPTLFIAYAFWRLGFRFVLPAFRKAPLEASVWYLAPFWFGVLLNITTNWIPIDRLVASDIQRRPGALTAIIILVIVLVIVVVNQVRVIRKTGWLFHYVGWYIAGGLVLLVLSQLPGLTLRLHHYIIPMALIPGTAFPTRLSAIYQGLLLGMFLNGIAAFGLDSILQTAEDVSNFRIESTLTFLRIPVSSAEMHRWARLFPLLPPTLLLTTHQYLGKTKQFSGMQYQQL